MLTFISRLAGITRTGVVVLMLSLLLPDSLWAAQHCVTTKPELLAALTSAAASPEADDIRVVQNTYNLTESVLYSVHGSLKLTGGWLAGCVIRNGNPFNTTIASSALQGSSITLNQINGDLTLESFYFLQTRGVYIYDFASGSGISGNLTIARNHFRDNFRGLEVSTFTKNIKIANNLFYDNNPAGDVPGGKSLRIWAASAVGSSDVAIEVVFNTVLSTETGVEIVGSSHLANYPWVQNNILRDAEVADLVVTDASLVASHNILGVTTFNGSGSFFSSTDNLVTPALLDGNFLPTNLSPAVNSGTPLLYTSVPVNDMDGGPRIVGSRPDRGALETAVDDNTTITVTSSADSGAGTLRQAILDANASAASNTINFNIAGGCPRIITLATPLPTVTDEVVIDGFSQPGSSPNTESFSYNGVHCIGLVGGVTHALSLAPTLLETITVKGLAFYDFSQAAVQSNGLGASFIEGNVFGTGLSLIAAGFDQYAISIEASPYSRIGGGYVEQRNLITRAANAGVRLINGGNRTVMGNFIGINKTGFGVAANGVGVVINGGTDDAVVLNYIGHNTVDGIRVEEDADRARIEFNYIGISPTMNASNNFQAPNGSDGIQLVDNGADNSIRFNEIAYNAGDGINVDSDVLRAWMAGNSIYDNAGLGIDLAPDGVNPNDQDVGASGANLKHNFPVLTKAEGSAYEGVVSGTLSSTNGLHVIEIFYSPSCDGTDHGEGQKLIGGTSVFISNAGATDGSESFTANVSSEPFGISMKLGAITATARDSSGNTSEFSQCLTYVQKLIFEDGFEG